MHIKFEIGGKIMNTEYYWLWLSSLDLFSHKNINILLDYFSSPEGIWKASTAELQSIKNISDKFIQKVLSTRHEKEIENKIKQLEKYNIKYISVENKSYPEKLKNIYDYPYGIYMKGSIEQKKTIAIVGSRKCSEYGAEVTKTFGKELAQNNITVVSGMAKGIDSLAHWGALEANIKHSTIAVLGCGLDICYPKENYELMNRIIENGAVISEYPLGTSPHSAFFPQRNRIISGLSEAIIVVEAARKSGSLITADQALEQGRDVFAVPGNITSKLSQGTNDLIRQGAMLVTSSNDVLNELGLDTSKYNKKVVEKINSEYFLAPDEKLVYDCISLEPQNIDVIFSKLECPINKLQYILTLLELKGYVQQLPGQRYVKNL